MAQNSSTDNTPGNTPDNTPDRSKQQGARITELETRLEFQDETISKLNDELVLHHQRLSEAEKKLQLILDRWPKGEQGASWGDNWQPDPQDEPPPPHY